MGADNGIRNTRMLINNITPPDVLQNNTYAPNASILKLNDSTG